MRVLVWVTPAGTMDEGGVEQPAYLNFDTTLLAAPLGNEMSVRAPCLPTLVHTVQARVYWQSASAAVMYIRPFPLE